MVASIPSPSFDSIDIGPLSLNIYGLMIALGVVAAVWLFGRRLEERGAGTTDDASAIAIWAVLAGVIGARLYHVATDWERFENDLGKIPAIWEGGLGIPGGLLFGIPVGLWVARRRGISFATAATCAAPAIPLAQAIGRWGNYFNQELYGRPTDLPWALEIDAEHLEPGYAVGTTFHPTFLYESLWSLGLVFFLLWVDRRWRPRGGSLMALYVAGYGLGRFWIEGLRIDPADEIAGLRWNQWVALVAFVGGLVAFWLIQRNAAPEDEVVDDEPHADGEEPLADEDERHADDEERHADEEPRADDERRADDAPADEEQRADLIDGATQGDERDDDPHRPMSDGDVAEGELGSDAGDDGDDVDESDAESISSPRREVAPRSRDRTGAPRSAGERD